MLAKPVNVSLWQQVVAALGVIVLQALAVGEVIRGEREAGRGGEGFPVHSHCTTEAWHYGGSRQCQNCLVVSRGHTMGVRGSPMETQGAEQDGRSAPRAELKRMRDKKWGWREVNRDKKGCGMGREKRK